MKTIKVNRDHKRIKVADRHNGHHVATAKNLKHSHVKTAKVSKPVKHANAGRTHGQVAHVVKNSKIIAN